MKTVHVTARYSMAKADHECLLDLHKATKRYAGLLEDLANCNDTSPAMASWLEEQMHLAADRLKEVTRKLEAADEARGIAAELALSEQEAWDDTTQAEHPDTIPAPGEQAAE